MEYLIYRKLNDEEIRKNSIDICNKSIDDSGYASEISLQACKKFKNSTVRPLASFTDDMFKVIKYDSDYVCVMVCEDTDYMLKRILSLFSAEGIVNYNSEMSLLESSKEFVSKLKYNWLNSNGNVAILNDFIYSYKLLYRNTLKTALIFDVLYKITLMNFTGNFTGNPDCTNYRFLDSINEYLVSRETCKPYIILSMIDYNCLVKNGNLDINYIKENNINRKILNIVDVNRCLDDKIIDAVEDILRLNNNGTIYRSLL